MSAANTSLHHKGHLLFLAHRIPYPPDKGDKIRSFHILKFLAEQGWSIHLGALLDEPEDLKHQEQLRSYCQSICLEPIQPFRRKAASLLRLWQGQPLSVHYFFRPRLQKYINQVLQDYPVQVVFCFSSPMAEYVFQAGLAGPPHNTIPQITNKRITNNESTKCIMDLVDVDSDKWQQYAARNKAPTAWLYSLEAKRLAEYEAKIAQHFDVIYLVSQQECQLLARRGITQKVQPLGNGVDLEYFAPAGAEQQSSGRQGLNLVFCGLMDYFPNVDAVSWFVRRVLPLIQEQCAEVTLQIVGAKPVQEVLELGAQPGVEVLGRVEDVRPYVWQADISVAPIRVARGVQNKVLEAMAMAKPVVATQEAFAGIQAEPGQDLLVTASEAGEFAQAVLELWQSPHQAASIAASGRKRMQEHYSWQVQLQPLSLLVY